jgi:hypothetical protein
MPVTMICPNLKCGRTVVAAESARGKIVRCVHCETLFMVPPAAPQPGAPPEEPAGGGTKKSKSR